MVNQLSIGLLLTARSWLLKRLKRRQFDEFFCKMFSTYKACSSRHTLNWDGETVLIDLYLNCSIPPKKVNEIIQVLVPLFIMHDFTLNEEHMPLYHLHFLTLIQFWGCSSLVPKNWLTFSRELYDRVLKRKKYFECYYYLWELWKRNFKSWKIQNMK